MDRVGSGGVTIWEFFAHFLVLIVESCNTLVAYLNSFLCLYSDLKAKFNFVYCHFLSLVGL